MSCLTPSSSSVLVNKSTDSVLYTVPDESIVLKNASLQVFTIVKKILVTLSLHKSVWSFDLYEEPGSRPLHKLACFQVITLNACCLSITKKDKSVGSPPVLTCIYPEDSTSVSTHQSDLHPHLEPHLFRLLFGVDAFSKFSSHSVWFTWWTYLLLSFARPHPGWSKRRTEISSQSPSELRAASRIYWNLHLWRTWTSVSCCSWSKRQTSNGQKQTNKLGREKGRL